MIASDTLPCFNPEGYVIGVHPCNIRLGIKDICIYYLGHLESKERLHIQPAQLFNFS